MAASGLDWLNKLPLEEATAIFQQCCGSTRWARELAEGRPYHDLGALTARANNIWWRLQPEDWLEAFLSHPKIGEKKAGQPLSAQSDKWSGEEQAAVSSASPETIGSLTTLNSAYEQKFGFIFIISATGKSSEEMLSALRERLENEPGAEIQIAAEEQSKITELRLRKVVS